MTKLELSEKGKSFHDALRVCLNWLAVGGPIQIESGHTLLMSEDGQPGFWAQRHAGDGKVEEIIFQIGSDVAWLSLVGYAMKMSEDQIHTMAANTALNTL